MNPIGNDIALELAKLHVLRGVDFVRQLKKVVQSGIFKPVENEKYAFRCFLLRLGFIGDEFKADRKVLLQNLSGSTAFKGGAK